jgi:hypothetical protein
VTGNSQGLEYHSQRRTYLKGSRIELEELEESKCWLAAKRPACRNKLLIMLNKSVKLIQVFQGLVSHVDHIGHRL